MIFLRMGLLPLFSNNECLCTACQTPQNWTKYQKTKDGQHQFEKTVFFENSNIDLPIWIQIIYLWGMRGANKNAATHRAIHDAFASLRQICQRHLLANPVELGKPGIVLEIVLGCRSQRSHSTVTYMLFWNCGYQL